MPHTERDGHTTHTVPFPQRPQWRTDLPFAMVQCMLSSSSASTAQVLLPQALHKQRSAGLTWRQMETVRKQSDKT